MKKVVLFAAIGMLVFASCKQEYICECFQIEDGIAFPLLDDAGVEIAPTFLATENKATEACNDYAILTDSSIVCTIQ